MPAGVSITLPGFRSRWTMPGRVRGLEGVRDFDAEAEDLIERQRAACETCAPASRPRAVRARDNRCRARDRCRTSRRCAGG